MDAEEEKFFTELAKIGGAGREEDMNVGFAKATSAAIRRPSAFASARSAKASESKSDEGADEALAKAGEPEGQLTIDVYQTPNDIIVRSAIAGVRPEDIDIDASPDSITIRGERHQEHKVDEEDYLYQECYWGRFSRSVILPQEVDADSASVTFKNGVLTIRLPKASRVKTKKLKVKSE